CLKESGEIYYRPFARELFRIQFHQWRADTRAPNWRIRNIWQSDEQEFPSTWKTKAECRVCSIASQCIQHLLS
ncbi:MAG TPA: hypothetical protein VFQ43_12515, partial [Nitrososphaera sp.]|nr:hypothetical protein [Nitrososphaera sp.]